MRYKKPAPGQMEKVHEMGTPWPEEDEPSNELAQVTDVPQMEPWDKRMFEIKKEKEKQRAELWK